MFGLSIGEILVLGVMALIVIGPKQLPELARNLGRFLNEMKRATEGFTEDLKQQARIDLDLNARPKPPPPAEPETATIADANRAEASPPEPSGPPKDEGSS